MAGAEADAPRAVTAVTGAVVDSVTCTEVLARGRPDIAARAIQQAARCSCEPVPS